MCGRFALYSDPKTLARRFGAQAPADLRPRYNVAPTQSIPIVREDDGQRRFALVRWRLIPHWAKEMELGYNTINARAETVASSPAYRSAFRHRRCLVVADGWFEWETRPDSKRKQPWFITLRDHEPMAFAGLWDRWHSPEGTDVESCTIIVTDANDRTRTIHPRMPVVLAPDDWDMWLAPEGSDPEMLKGLLRPYPADGVTAWPVSTVVNNTRNDSPECVARIDEEG